MQIVIDIGEKIYDTITSDTMPTREELAVIVTRIYQGIVLPKGHGDLIDRSKIAFDYWSFDGYACVEKKDIFKMPVIVPADKMETEQMLNTPMEIQNEIRDARMLELIKAQGVTQNEHI